MPEKPMYLRVEPANEGDGEEYRIHNKRIEVRRLSQPGHVERCWRGLTSEEIASHVHRNSVVARWLELRLGWRCLLQACIADEDLSWVERERHRTECRAA
jgi:hypothetical protein